MGLGHRSILQCNTIKIIIIPNSSYTTKAGNISSSQFVSIGNRTQIYRLRIQTHYPLNQ